MEPWYYSVAASGGMHHFGFGVTYSRYDYGSGDALRAIFRQPVALTQSAVHLGAGFDFGGWLVENHRLLASIGSTVKWADVFGADGWEVDGRGFVT
jgi:hypothetical protein